MLEQRRLLSTSLAYSYNSDADNGTAAAGVVAAWADAGDGSKTLTLGDLAPHQMVYVAVGLDAGEAATLTTAGRTSAHAAGAAATGTDGWIASDAGTVTVSVAGDGADLHVYTYQPTISVTGDAVASPDNPAVLTVQRDLPAVFNGVTTNETAPEMTAAVSDNGGTAQPGVDYALSRTAVTLPAGGGEGSVVLTSYRKGDLSAGKVADLVFDFDDADSLGAETVLTDASPPPVRNAPGVPGGNSTDYFGYGFNYNPNDPGGGSFVTADLDILGGKRPIPWPAGVGGMEDMGGGHMEGYAGFGFGVTIHFPNGDHIGAFFPAGTVVKVGPDGMIESILIPWGSASGYTIDGRPYTDYLPDGTVRV